jgi:hypothetical protein
VSSGMAWVEDIEKTGLPRFARNDRMQTTVQGGGTVSFYWKVSSTEDHHYLEFYVDGALQSSISGDVDWEVRTCTVSGAGSHTPSFWRRHFFFIDPPSSGRVSTGHQCSADGIEDGVRCTPYRPFTCIFTFVVRS